MNRFSIVRLAVGATLTMAVLAATMLPALAAQREFTFWNTGPDVVSIKFPEGIAGAGVVVENVSAHEFKRVKITDGPFRLTIKGPKYGGGCGDATKDVPAGKNVVLKNPCAIDLT